MMDELVELLTKKKLTLSSVESLTSGLFCSKVAEVNHASAILYGGINTYKTDAKVEILGIDKNELQKHGVVSDECAKMMCEKGHKLMKTDIVVSCTGNAGPTAMENKAVGLVYIGIYFKGNIETKKLNLKGSRNDIRNLVVDEMVKLIKETLEM